MFQTPEKLTQFAKLRVRYLLAVLKEVLAMPTAPVDLTSDARDYLLDVCNVDPQSTDFDTLLIFDSMQFTMFWGAEWGNALSASQSRQQLIDKMSGRGQGQADQSSSSNPATTTAPPVSWTSFKKAVAETMQDSAAVVIDGPPPGARPK